MSENEDARPSREMHNLQDSRGGFEKSWKKQDAEQEEEHTDDDCQDRFGVNHSNRNKTYRHRPLGDFDQGTSGQIGVVPR